MTERILCVILLSLTEICVCIYYLQLFECFMGWWGREGDLVLLQYEQLFKKHISVTSLIRTDTHSWCLSKNTEDASFKKDHMILVSISEYIPILEEGGKMSQLCRLSC